MTVQPNGVPAWQINHIAEILQKHQDEHFVGFRTSDGRSYCGARVHRGRLECLLIGQAGWVPVDPAQVEFVDHNNRAIACVL